jgi:hypothetical protein
MPEMAANITRVVSLRFRASQRIPRPYNEAFSIALLNG